LWGFGDLTSYPGFGDLIGDFLSSYFGCSLDSAITGEERPKRAIDAIAEAVNFILIEESFFSKESKNRTCPFTA
jgi:hypothetical protein